MRKGLAELDNYIARVESIPQVLSAAAPDVAQAVEDELRRTIKAGTTPEGTAWEPRQDGEKPLATAAKSLVVVPIGTRVFARLRGHVARHHRGIARGGITRPILPAGKLPPKMAASVRSVLLQHMSDHLKGGG